MVKNMTKKFGRPVNVELCERVYRLRKKGLTFAAIGAEVGLTRQTVCSKFYYWTKNRRKYLKEITDLRFDE